MAKPVPTKPTTPRPRLPIVREEDGRLPRVGPVQHEQTRPGIGDSFDLREAAEEETPTGLQSRAALFQEYSRAIKELHELRDAAARVVPVESEPPGVRRKTSLAVKILGALAGLLTASAGVIVAITAFRAPPPPDNGVMLAGAIKAEADLETRVARLERCFADRSKADDRDAALLEGALHLAGVEIQPRPGAEPSEPLKVEASPLVNPKRGERPTIRIITTRPERVRCQ